MHFSRPVSDRCLHSQYCNRQYLTLTRQRIIFNVMLFAKLFVAFVVLLERMCLSKITINVNKSHEFAEIGEAAIQISVTCYANEHKTIVLLGDYPNIFIKNLSIDRSFSLILLDDKRRAENNNRELENLDVYRSHKVHIVILIASFPRRFLYLLRTYRLSAYNNPMAFVLLLGWSPKNVYTPCSNNYEIVNMLFSAQNNDLLNANLICRDRNVGIVIYGFNPFINRAPNPWQLVKFKHPNRKYRHFFFYVQKYRKHKKLCETLNFEKTDDLGGAFIDLVWHDLAISEKESNRVNKFINTGKSSDQNKTDVTIKRLTIEQKKRFTFFYAFIGYVNGRTRDIWVKTIKGDNTIAYPAGIQTRPNILRGITKSFMANTYPTGVECKILLTQFRGNKSQLKKFITVIDVYSWIGVSIVCLITLIFLKTVLHQSATVGILNVLRIICNFGLETLPSNLPPRIYLVSLFFFIMTMRQFFESNLSSVLTEDIPVRQVNSIKDLADLDLRVYAEGEDFIYFNDSVFKGRVILKLANDDCIPYVLRDPSIACLTWGGAVIDDAVQYNLHISDDCVLTEYITNLLPRNWPLQEKLNKFNGLMIDAGTFVPLDTIVKEIRLREAVIEDDDSDPKVITLGDLSFAFVFLAIGTICAFISFIGEIIIFRILYRRRTQLIVFN